ncbi:IS110 family transposase [Marinitoga hydrogenitolerans]|uniref:IS110 family transposase n=1 Tax=Marinitoga hydrogenitolerans TaxID=287990 RepID=UPI000A00A3EA|nr:transposase [Marinitoga hydrogenitolerans]
MDISSTKFDVAIFDGKKFKHFVFKQSYDGFNEFLDVIKNINDEYMIAMESIGTYHLALKQFLNEKGFSVLILHPYSLKNFMRSFNHSKTDKIDSKNIAKAIYILREYAIRSSEPDDLILELRNLLRARKNIAKSLASLKTHL